VVVVGSFNSTHNPGKQTASNVWWFFCFVSIKYVGRLFHQSIGFCIIVWIDVWTCIRPACPNNLKKENPTNIRNVWKSSGRLAANTPKRYFEKSQRTKLKKEEVHGAIWWEYVVHTYEAICHDVLLNKLPGIGCVLHRNDCIAIVIDDYLSIRFTCIAKQEKLLRAENFFLKAKLKENKQIS
jgi:hypothetical protein